MIRNKTILPITMVVAGGVLMALRIWLYQVALDEKNMLVANHPISMVIWVVTAICLAVALKVGLRKSETGNVPVYTMLAALGDLLFAAILGFFVYAMGEPVTLVEKLRLGAGVLCIPLLMYSAAGRIRRKPLFFGGFAVVAMFFSLYLVASYQLWSSNPQLQDYVFAMLACVAVTLFAYQNAAYCVDGGNENLWRAAGMLTVCFGIAAVAQSQHNLLYGGIALWALTGLLPEREF